MFRITAIKNRSPFLSPVSSAHSHSVSLSLHLSPSVSLSLSVALPSLSLYFSVSLPSLSLSLSVSLPRCSTPSLSPSFGTLTVSLCDLISRRYFDRATLVGLGQIELRTSKMRTSRWTFLDMWCFKLEFCNTNHLFTDDYSPSRSSHLGSSKFDLDKSYLSGSICFFQPIQPQTCQPIVHYSSL